MARSALGGIRRRSRRVRGHSGDGTTCRLRPTCGWSRGCGTGDRRLARRCCLALLSDHGARSRRALNQTRTCRGGLCVRRRAITAEACATADQDGGDQPHPSRGTSMRHPVGLAFGPQFLNFHDLTRTDRFPHPLDRRSGPFGLTAIRGSVEIVASVSLCQRIESGRKLISDRLGIRIMGQTRTYRCDNHRASRKICRGFAARNRNFPGRD